MTAISPEYCQMMARYNAWQNTQVRDACKSLSAAELTEDRGVFFGSLMATINHLLWGDTIWMSRFDGGPAPSVPAAQHREICADFGDWVQAREAMDQRISTWAATLTEDALAKDLSWFSGLFQKDYTMPMAMCVTHMFNHQTHHRGQIHAMLTGLGRNPGDTDLIFLPEDT